jgi:ribosomal peptide maturation radical SAM protein 1
LGAHILQACARERGFSVAVLYANLLLAQKIGPHRYEAICYAPTTGLIGERLFSRVAYGMPSMGYDVTGDELYFKRVSKNINLNLDFPELQEIEQGIDAWIEEIAEGITALSYPIVGCTTTFEQTSASIALLRALKRRSPQTLAIMGGANCEGEMAEGILSLCDQIDFVFSGECETAFPDFLQQIAATSARPQRVVYGSPNRKLDAIPTPDFSDFYAQLEELQTAETVKQQLWLPYETSRGCWWGERRHCTFCGINGQGMAFREKSKPRVLEELRVLLARHPNRRICMVDNIMPHRYFQELLPDLARELPDLHIFYEQKANLTFEKVLTLRRAGVAVIQPGIEALSTDLLHLMKKGVTSDQNVNLLRYARSAGVAVNWNLLYAFPGDCRASYERTLQLLPLLEHLHPPTGVFHLSVDRFSPYFDAPQSYGISDVKPISEYFNVFPEASEVFKLAYHFEASYTSASKADPDLIRELKDGVERWRKAWESAEKALPTLEVLKLSDDVYLLIDTRAIRVHEFQLITPAQAIAAVFNPKIETAARHWALQYHVAAAHDGQLLPLATASPEVTAELIAAAKSWLSSNPSPDHASSQEVAPIT